MVSVPRALATAAVLLGALQTTAQAKELVVAIFGGSFLENTKACHGAPFEKRTGAKVNFVLGNSVQNVAKLRVEYRFAGSWLLIEPTVWVWRDPDPERRFDQERKSFIPRAPRAPLQPGVESASAGVGGVRERPAGRGDEGAPAAPGRQACRRPL